MYESRPFIGGKVASWQKDGNHVEMGLHVVRCSAPARSVPVDAVPRAQHTTCASLLSMQNPRGSHRRQHADLCLFVRLLISVVCDMRSQVLSYKALCCCLLHVRAAPEARPTARSSSAATSTCSG